MMRYHNERPPVRRVSPVHDSKPPIGDGHRLAQEALARQGSELLCDAIEDLVARTSKRIPIPAEWQHRKLAFTRAYLGMEVAK